MASDKWYNLLSNSDYEDYTAGLYQPVTYQSDFNNFSAQLLTKPQTQQDSGSGFGSIGQMFSPMLQMFQSINMLNDGVKMAIDGSKFQAGVYRSSGKAAMQGANFEASVLRQAGNTALQVTKYNVQLDKLQTDRQQEALGRQIDDTLSSNYAVAGATGASIYSKSTMMVQNEVLSNAETMFNRNKNDAIQRQSLMEFQGALTNAQYENQARAAEYQGKIAVQNAENNARAAEYQGQIDAYKAKSQMSSTISGSIGDMFKMFGGL